MSEGEKSAEKKSKVKSLTKLSERFILAVNLILAKNKAEGKLPVKQTQLSLLISNQDYTIAKIVSGLRTVNINQIEQLGKLYPIDFNFFFRDSVSELFLDKVKPESHSNQVNVSVSGSPGATTIQGVTGNVKVNNKVDKIVALIPDKIKEEYKEVLVKEAEDIKKISDDYAAMVQQLQSELKEEKTEKMEFLKKYMAELKKNVS